ncbi:ATP-dependent RNA helicase HrpA [Isoptericola sp. NEAU-Y5]|uniref:ATP-dependent RNA helicase HrpA n=1 Tax=Isoptericola luteus TaxID=2879484 RepID=A0ABS7Z9J5_9MICO|nr:ATP-dependent RNA helicase HrpA [Isoptericola sp. NEAU-Y5]MCA5891737.1 ATP-dependent RNA helicase HrpA [Isoptericola sp. NEAU-Y5]MCA5894570.1 ATP-dependent RNA helicase HrpA [Isoptericola sp. NEAU-Y5]
MSTEPSPAPQSSSDDGGARRPRRRGRGRGQGGGQGRENRAGNRGAPQRSGPRRVSREQLEKAAAKRAAVEVPPIVYPEQLPVSARREDIASAIRTHQVVVVAGETGSGKTTQLPKILLELGRGRAGQIGHTQPRRIAARSVAERVASELGTELGGVVGYQVRFTDQSSDSTLVKVMTDGILLAQIQRDPDLLAYDTIVIDEAHERSLNIDFLLGYLSRLLPRRPDLKLVITSATIDSARFAAHFSPAHLAEVGGAPEAVVDVLPDAAPVVEVTGRTYPVEIRWRPLSPDTDPDQPKKAKGGSDRDEKDLVTGIVEACDELMREGPGDILVFLSGEREIHDAADALEGHLKERVRDPKHPQHVEILPLYSRLSAAEQHRVFESHAGRRIVLSTNVAETSLTVPGIHYVVDPGTARISRYSKATKVQRLPIEPVSQASANQRSGRSGRVADGVAIRLYSEEDFLGRPEFTEPEILRTSLASVLLQMISVGVVSTPDDVARFPFVEPPDTRSVRDGVQLLTELGALANQDGRTRLTDVGRTLAQLPMDPRLARMIIEGAKQGVAREVAIIAAVLSIQDPRERPAETRAQADQLHARFTDPHSDFLTYLNLWEYVRGQQHEMGSSAFRRMCKAEHLNFLRIREWQDVVAQLREMSKPLGIDMRYTPNTTRPSGRDGAGSAASDAKGVEGLAGASRGTSGADGSPSTDAADLAHHRHSWDGDTIHRSLLAGLLSQLGMQDTGEIKASSVAHLRGEARARALRQAAKRARNEYVGARGARFAIFPGSPLSKKPPEWIMAGELVETSRLWARDVARIRPEWAEELAGPLAKRTYSDPHWSTKQGAAVATEKVLLYGVPIVADRPVLFAKVDAEAAREMFVRHALVEGQWTTHHRFFAENRRLLAEAEELEARSRRRGLVASEDDLFAFYDERVPASVVSAAHFDTWWKQAQRETPDLLTFTLDQLVDTDAVDTGEFPQAWTQGEVTLPLTYQFSPGTAADGVTVHVPLSILNRVTPDGFDWMVPGLLDELCVATIRSLPKTVRRELVPAPDIGAAVAGWLREHTPSWDDLTRAGDMAAPFHVEFTRAVRALRGVDIPDEVWDAERVERLPAHLRMTFRVEEGPRAPAQDAPGPQGKGRGRKPRAAAPALVDESKDLLALQRRLAARSEAAVRAAVKGAVGVALEEARRASATGAGVRAPAASGTPGRQAGPPGLPPTTPASPSARAAAPAADGSGGAPRVVAEQVGLSTWPTGLPDGALPSAVSTDLGGGVVVRGYPALVEEEDAKRRPSVALRVLADVSGRDDAHARGVRRLLLGETALQAGRITSRWTASQSLTLAAAPYRNTEALVADLQLAAVTALTSPDAAKAHGTPTGGPVAARVVDAASYVDAVAFVRRHLEDEVHRVVGHAVAALSAWRTVEGEVRASSSLALLNTLQDVRGQVAGIVHDGFVAATPPRRLPHLVRYLRAASARLEKAQGNPTRDAELAWRVHDVTEAYDKARAAYATGPADPARAAELAEVRWLVEELRVSLFAQQLGTDGAVSEKRIRKILSPNGW